MGIKSAQNEKGKQICITSSCTSYNYEKQVFEYEFVNLYDGFVKHFGTSLMIRLSDLWVIAELFETFYTLKETVEVLGRGGSHYTTNPISDLIKNTNEVERINNIVLPAIFEEIYKILLRNQNNTKLLKNILNLNLKGDTVKVVNFMKENDITTDDLKAIDGLSKGDYRIIHRYYWKEYHANK